MTERAKSSDDHCSRLKMCLGWPMEPVKRNERHILKKSKIMHVYYLIVLLYILLNNKTAGSLIYRAWPDGKVKPLYSPCSGPLMGNKYLDSLPGRPGKCMTFQVKMKGQGRFLTETPSRTECPRDCWKYLSVPVVRGMAWHACPLITGKHPGRRHFEVGAEGDKTLWMWKK